MTETPILCTGTPVVVWDVDRGTPETSDFLNNQFTWPDIDITYNPFDHSGKVPLQGQKVKAKIMLQRTLPSGEVEYCDPDYRLNSISITSNLARYPYPDSQVDPNTPTEYGGVIFYQDSSGNKKAGEYSECGIVEGFYQWMDSNLKSQSTASGYIYVDVFDDTEFSYIPLNEDEPVSMKDRVLCI